MDIKEELEQAYAKENDRQHQAFLKCMAHFNTYHIMDITLVKDTAATKAEWYVLYSTYKNLISDSPHFKKKIKNTLEKGIEAFKFKDF